MKISLCIVNWDGGNVFERCIRVIRSEVESTSNLKYEIVVVDNASKNLSEDIFNNLNYTIIRNTSNLLFAKATNQSIEASTGDVLIIMNNDVELREGFLQKVVTIFNGNEKVDVLIPKILLPNGKIQKSITGFPTTEDVFYIATGVSFVNRNFNKWLDPYFNYSLKQTVPKNLQPAFSAVIMRRRVWKFVGELDENFPLLWNDTDWFYRYSISNFLTLYDPQLTCSHTHGYSVNKNRLKKSIISISSMNRFMKKNYKCAGINVVILDVLCLIVFLEKLIIDTMTSIKNNVTLALNGRSL